ncbi:MAG: hypothetical protein ABIT37_21695 [Luteolibacter sp.]
MIKSPFYLLWAILCLGYLTLANLRGWSLIHTLTPNRAAAHGTSGLNHK